MEQRAEVFLWDPLEKGIAMDHLMNINHASLVPNAECKWTGYVKVHCAHMDIYGCMKQRIDHMKAERYCILH